MQARSKAASATQKRYLRGTHRVCDPDETFTRLLPRLPAFGITRVADVTRLDRIGIPTYQAIRPNSRSLSVSQGKGLTASAAKVSAVMESIEAWHAERLPPPACTVTVGELAGELEYDVYELRHIERSLLNDGMRLGWLRARRMSDDGRETLVPREYVTLDFRIEQRWQPPVFAPSSNGLASGNTLEEAALHALCELVERDASVRLRARAPAERAAVAPETVDAPDAARLLARLRAAEMSVEILECTGPTRIPSFEVVIGSEDHPARFLGAGSHPDSEVALCRALTEAAQSRLATISGSRDDVPVRSFRQFFDRTGAAGRGHAPLAERRVSFRDTPSEASDDIGRDLREVVARVSAQTGSVPLLLDLSRPDIGVAVVKTIAPGLLYHKRTALRHYGGRRAA